MRKVTLTLDEETVRRLDRLARPRAGNKSFVVREAVRLMAETEALEERLVEVEADPAFQASMARALKEIRAGETIAHEEVERRLRSRKRR
jgi:predicted transcriptional regulator